MSKIKTAVSLLEKHKNLSSFNVHENCSNVFEFITRRKASKYDSLCDGKVILPLS
jgi:hypothetical protein